MLITQLSPEAIERKRAYHREYNVLMTERENYEDLREWMDDLRRLREDGLKALHALIYADALNGAIVGAPADPEAFG